MNAIAPNPYPEDPAVTQELDRLRQMNVAELVVRYTDLFGQPPRVRHKEHLWKRCAWKFQERRFGGLSEVAKRRLEELIAEIKLPFEESIRTVTGVLKRPARPKRPSIGTTLVRRWRDQEIHVRVVEGGFEWNDVVYRSLTAVARAVTGSRWNGNLFFGIRPRSKAK